MRGDHSRETLERGVAKADDRRCAVDCWGISLGHIWKVNKEAEGETR